MRECLVRPPWAEYPRANRGQRGDVHGRDFSRQVVCPGMAKGRPMALEQSESVGTHALGVSHAAMFE